MNDFCNRARGLLADALELEPGQIADDASMETVGEWTSLGHMRLVLALEETLGRELDPASIVDIASLTDIVALLRSGR